MLEFKSENQKLREEIPMTDGQLFNWLVRNGVPFDCGPDTEDKPGAPWLTHERLKWVIGEFLPF